MRHVNRRSAATVALATLLVGCSAAELDEPPIASSEVPTSSDRPESVDDAGSTETQTEAAQNVDESEHLAALYRDALSNPGQFEVNDAARYTPDGSYSYAVVEATGDDSPDLLLRVNSAEFSPVILLTSNGSQVVGSTEVLLDGAASDSTSISVHADRKGRGVFENTWKNGDPTDESYTQGTSSLWALSGTQLEPVQTAHLTEQTDPNPDVLPVVWYDADDFTGVSKIEDDSVMLPSGPAKDIGDNRRVFRGTLVEKRSSDFPYPENDLEEVTYWILELDRPFLTYGQPPMGVYTPHYKPTTAIELANSSLNDSSVSQYASKRVAVTLRFGVIGTPVVARAVGDIPVAYVQDWIEVID